MKVHITAERALSGLRKAVAERGENYRDENAAIGQACRYEVDGSASCIVGWVLMEDFGIIGLRDYAGSVTNFFPDLTYHEETRRVHMDGIEEFTYDEKALQLLRLAQTSQDRGERYINVLAYVETMAAQLGVVVNDTPEVAVPA